jgi:hypothetical protein
VVRAALFGQDHPEFTGLVSFRATIAREKVAQLPNIDAFTKWWGPQPSIQIVTFPLNRGREQFIFATTAQDGWRDESWTLPGDVHELRRIYQDFHPEARALLDACTEVTKSALYVREPMPQWSQGAVTLLGDACHPMVPFMARRLHGAGGRGGAGACPAGRTSRAWRRRWPVMKTPARSAPPGCSAARAATNGSSRAATPTGSTVTTPGRWHWPIEDGVKE